MKSFHTSKPYMAIGCPIVPQASAEVHIWRKYFHPGPALGWSGRCTRTGREAGEADSTRMQPGQLALFLGSITAAAAAERQKAPSPAGKKNQCEGGGGGGGAMPRRHRLQPSWHQSDKDMSHYWARGFANRVQAMCCCLPCLHFGYQDWSGVHQAAPELFRGLAFELLRSETRSR